jgi:hypothetical protein
MTKQGIRLLTSLCGLVVLLSATAPAAPAVSSVQRLAGTIKSERLGVVQGRQPIFAQGCPKMEVSDPALWFVADEEGNVDTEQVVDRYPGGVRTIAAGFEYNCVPPKTALVIVFYALSVDSDPWFTDEGNLPPSTNSGSAYYPVELKDKKPIPDGDYRAEFYIGEELLTSGDITVGESETQQARDWFTKDNQEQQQEQQTQEPQKTLTQGPEPEPTQEQQPPTRQAEKTPTQEPEPEPTQERQRDNKVQIVGTIMDGATDRPIRGAVFVVLYPGVTVAQWRDYAFAPSDILSTNETDRNGQFKQPGLERNVEYSVVAWALSYQGWYQDGFLLTDDDPDPYELTITLVR